jgi:predicted DNA-binding transcriptional regulator AlpA
MNWEENSEFCTIADAAKRTGLTRKTWYQGGAGTDGVPRVKFGRSVRLVRADVERFISDRINRAAERSKSAAPLEVVDP